MIIHKLLRWVSPNMFWCGIDLMNQKLTKIMASQTEIINELNALVPEIQNFGTEINGLKGNIATLQQSVTDLQAQIANGDVSQELKDAADAVKAAADAVEAGVPDAPTIPASMQDMGGAPTTDANAKAASPQVDPNPQSNDPATAADKMQATTAEAAGAAPSGATQP